MAQADHPCEVRMIKEARHKSLFEKEAMLAETLNALVDFFAAHP
nr:lysophospholipase L2 [Candidatus Pantoea persica]